jgi:hypothetical protein
MSLIRNEQAKLSATYLNGIAIALAAVGGIATWVSYLLQASPSSVLLVAAISVLCICLSASLHWIARKVLTGLRER